MDRAQVLARIRQLGVVPVVRASNGDEALALIDALHAGGVDVIELTMTVPFAVELIRELSKKSGGKFVLGAGTVLDAETARACMLAGAQFIVSPATDEATITSCRTYGVPIFAGALTPTEVVRAWKAGADMVKVFPCGSLGGASYIKALKAPLPQIELVPTGGVSLETAADFIAAGASAVGAGADLVDLKKIRAGDAASITARARRYVEEVARAASLEELKMPITAIDSDRLYRKIARMLSELIANGEFVPGQRLPGERDLARQLGVSRPSVREALIALEVEGKVEVRVGAGVFVSQLPARKLPDRVLDQGEGPFELIRARWIIEGETAAIAAEESTPADRIELRAAVEALRTGETTKQRENADRRLHLAIGAASHNGPLAEIVTLLWDQGRGALWKKLEQHFSTPATTAQTLRDHDQVVLAIEAGDPVRARKAMHEHLTRVHRAFARGFAPARPNRSGHPASLPRRSGP